MRRVPLATALLLTLAGPARAEDGSLIRFVACPIYRDTDAGRKSGCWLADDPASGARYDVSLGPTKPDWNYAVLVEGRGVAVPDGACGGRVLDPVRVSILDERCVRHMLPAEGFPGRKFVLPPRVVKPLSAPSGPTPTGPFRTRSFSIFYEFNRDFLLYQYGDYLLDQAVQWMRAAHPVRIVVTGYAATDPVTVSGRTLREDAAIARSRAENVAETLRRLGFSADSIVVRSKLHSMPIDDPGADGLPDQSRRRVEIRAEVGRT